MNSARDDAHHTVAMFLDGRWSRSDCEATLQVINPSNGRCCTVMAAGCPQDADRAVASARNAFDDGRWSDAAPSVKKRTLHRFADLIAAEAAALDALDAVEMGKPVRESFGNAAAAAELMRFYAEAVDKVHGDLYSSDRQSLVMQRQVPRGVVAAIVPWNFPTYVAVLKIAPALAAGNCLVLKPSELSPRSALRLAELALQAGLPAGVLNVVPGLGETVGRALGLHSEVDMLAFTGSTEIGKRMLQYSAQSNMKVVMAECGGKSPQIVFDDGVDLDSACDAITAALLTNQGQICSVGSRLLVQRSIQSQAVERIASRIERIVMGDALDAATTFGPLASAKQCTQVLQYIDAGRTEGARLVTGGRRARADSGGYFVEPTLFDAVSPGSRIAREEIFGPVLAVIPFDNEDDALRIANATTYGLAAYVWTADLGTAMRMARGIRSSVWINAVAPLGEGAGHAGASEPAGQSGVGVEGGLAGMSSYMRRQLLWVNHG